MMLENLQPMSDEECQKANGGFIQFLLGSLLAGLAIPIIKNLWNTTSGSIKLPGGIESKWDNSNNESKDLKKIKDDLHKLEEKLTHLIPPFYEF